MGLLYLILRLVAECVYKKLGSEMLLNLKPGTLDVSHVSGDSFVKRRPWLCVVNVTEKYSVLLVTCN